MIRGHLDALYFLDKSGTLRDKQSIFVSGGQISLSSVGLKSPLGGGKIQPILDEEKHQ